MPSKSSVIPLRCLPKVVLSKSIRKEYRLYIWTSYPSLPEWPNQMHLLVTSDDDDDSDMGKWRRWLYDAAVGWQTTFTNTTCPRGDWQREMLFYG